MVFLGLAMVPRMADQELTIDEREVTHEEEPGCSF
jgi:hypothetical protein